MRHEIIIARIARNIQDGLQTELHGFDSSNLVYVEKIGSYRCGIKVVIIKEKRNISSVRRFARLRLPPI